ncbi:MAG: CsbD family protein [Bdellovibrionales bacterium]
MEINRDTVNGKWLEIKGDLQKAWGKLTDDELEKTKGDLTSIRGLIQQRYGEAHEKSLDKLNDIFKKFEVKKDEKIEEVKRSI